MKTKTKKLLDNLKNITAKKDKFATKPIPSSTNRINNITGWINKILLEYPPIS